MLSLTSLLFNHPVEEKKKTNPSFGKQDHLPAKLSFLVLRSLWNPCGKLLALRFVTIIAKRNSNISFYYYYYYYCPLLINVLQLFFPTPLESSVLDWGDRGCGVQKNCCCTLGFPL